MPVRYEIIAVEGLPEVRRGDDLAPLMVEAARRQATPLQARDLLVVSQKIVSKAEGRVVRLADVAVSEEARTVAGEVGRDPRLVAVILGESRRIVRKAKDVLIVETHHGQIHAFNAPAGGAVFRVSLPIMQADPGTDAGSEGQAGASVRAGERA